MFASALLSTLLFISGNVFSQIITWNGISGGEKKVAGSNYSVAATTFTSALVEGGGGRGFTLFFLFL